MLHHRDTLDWYRPQDSAPGRAAIAGMRPAARTDFVGLLQILRRRILFIAVTMALFVALAAAYVALAKPQYSSSASILIDPRRRQVVNSEVVPSGLGNDMAVVQSLVQSQLELIQSQAVLRRVVESEHLDADPEFVGDGTVDPLTALRQGIGRLMTFGAAVPANPGAGDPAAAALHALGENLKVTRAQQTYVIEIAVTARSPEKAARLAQAVAEAYLADQLQVKADANRQANGWLTSRLDELRDRMLASEKAVADYKAAHDIVSIEGGLVSEKQMARLNEQLVLIRAQRAEAEARYDQARRLLVTGAALAAPGGETVSNDTIQKLRQQYAEIARQESEQAILLGPRHPRLQSIRAQLAKTAGLIKTELERLASAAKAEAEIARDRENALDKSIAAAERESRINSQDEVRLRELVSEAETSRAIYTEFLSRAKETGGQDGLDTIEARIISPATLPLRPVSPRKMIALALALASGLGFGIGGALLREHLAEEAGRAARQPQPAPKAPRAAAAVSTGRRRDAESTLERLADLPAVAAASPLAVFAEIANRPTGPLAGAFRALREGLDAPFGDGRRRLAVIVSAVPGEGRSSVAAGLAMTSALAGERVLLVDADGRNGGLTRAINPTATVSIVDVAEGTASLESAAVHDPESGLVFASLAAPDAGPLDWSRGLAAVRTLAREAAAYDLVVVDTAPMLTDASVRLFVDLADQAVLVTRDPTGRDIAAAAESLHLPADCRRGIVTLPATPAGRFNA